VTLIYEESPDHVATITINRPLVLNAFDRVMMDEFEQIWQRVRRNDDVHAVVLRAAAGRAFSVGADLKTGGDIKGSDNVWSQADPGNVLGPKAMGSWKPIVAAVHGLCAGG